VQSQQSKLTDLHKKGLGFCADLVTFQKLLKFNFH